MTIVHYAYKHIIFKYLQEYICVNTCLYTMCMYYICISIYVYLIQYSQVYWPSIQIILMRKYFLLDKQWIWIILDFVVWVVLIQETSQSSILRKQALLPIQDNENFSENHITPTQKFIKMNN